MKACMCVANTCSARGVQKGASVHLKLDLQMGMSNHASALLSAKPSCTQKFKNNKTLLRESGTGILFPSKDSDSGRWDFAVHIQLQVLQAPDTGRAPRERSTNAGALLSSVTKAKKKMVRLYGSFQKPTNRGVALCGRGALGSPG